MTAPCGYGETNVLGSYGLDIKSLIFIRFDCFLLPIHCV